MRQERLEHEFAHNLGQLAIAPQAMARLERTAAELDGSPQSATDQLQRRLKADYDRLQARIETIYLDRLDARIDTVFFDQMAGEWRR